MTDANEVSLKVDGKLFKGWKSVSIKRGISAVCGGFTLSVTDRSGFSDQPFIFGIGSKCEVFIGEDRMINGYIERINPSVDVGSRTITISGRDKTCDLVDCTPFSKTKSLDRVKFVDLARQICSLFGIEVISQVSASTEVISSSATSSPNPGEKAFEQLEKTARAYGILMMPDGNGNLLLTKASKNRSPTSLLYGKNILSASGSNDGTNRFSEYRVLTQLFGGPEVEPGMLSVSASSKDPGVTRYRPYLIHADEGFDQERCQKRANWEASVRAARSSKFSVATQGWRRGDGKLWQINEIYRVECAPIYISGDYLATAIEFAYSEGGSITTIDFESRDAYQADQSVNAESNGWNNLLKANK